MSELYNFLKKTFPRMTLKEGLATWYLLQNADLIVNGEDINGSFRWTGGEIAKVTGYGDYMTYYCSHPTYDMKKPVYKRQFVYSMDFTKEIAKKLLDSRIVERIVINKKTCARLWNEMKHEKVEWTNKWGDEKL